MKEEDLINIWKSSPDEELGRLEKSRMISDIQSDADRWTEALKNRDLQVGIVLLFVIIFFGIAVYTTPFIISKIGAILCISPFIYYFMRLRKVKKLKPRSYSETFIDYLYKIREHLQAYKKFSDNMLYWVFLPCTLGAILFRLGFFINTNDSILKIFGIIGISTVGYYLYKWANKKLFISRLEKVEKLIKALEE